MKVGINLINFGPGASPDALLRWTRLAEALGYHFVMTSDHVAMTAYGAWGDKVMYGKHMLGVIRSTYLIDRQGKIAAAWPKVALKGHVDAVLTALEKLG